MNEFDQKVSEIMKDDNVARHVAMERAGHRFPALLAKYQSSEDILKSYPEGIPVTHDFNQKLPDEALEAKAERLAASRKIVLSRARIIVVTETEVDQNDQSEAYPMRSAAKAATDAQNAQDQAHDKVLIEKLAKAENLSPDQALEKFVKQKMVKMKTEGRIHHDHHSFQRAIEKSRNGYADFESLAQRYKGHFNISSTEALELAHACFQPVE